MKGFYSAETALSCETCFVIVKITCFFAEITRFKDKINTKCENADDLNRRLYSNYVVKTSSK